MRSEGWGGQKNAQTKLFSFGGLRSWAVWGKLRGEALGRASPA
jgi:hypothetical protein